MIWMKFVAGLFNKVSDDEQALFRIFVHSIIHVFPTVLRKAHQWVFDQGEKIRRDIEFKDNSSGRVIYGGHYNHSELELAERKLAEATEALNVIETVITRDNIDVITAAGLNVVVDDYTEEKLVDALTTRMKRNIITTKGIKDGNETGKPPDIPPEATRQQVQAVVDEELPPPPPDEPPAQPPAPRGRGRPKGTTKEEMARRRAEAGKAPKTGEGSDDEDEIETALEDEGDGDVE
jgi:hypothetical protein